MGLPSDIIHVTTFSGPSITDIAYHSNQRLAWERPRNEAQTSTQTHTHLHTQFAEQRVYYQHSHSPCDKHQSIAPATSVVAVFIGEALLSQCLSVVDQTVCVRIPLNSCPNPPIKAIHWLRGCHLAGGLSTSA